MELNKENGILHRIYNRINNWVYYWKIYVPNKYKQIKFVHLRKMAILKVCFICNMEFDKLKDLNAHFKSEEHKKAYFREHGRTQDEDEALIKKLSSK